MSKDYILKFDLSTFDELDKFALLADQKDNLGDKGDWFNHFRGGKSGLFARIAGVKIHYYKVHVWDLDIIPVPIEYHLSSILFNMDSALECMVFTLNALGYIADSDKFKDVTDTRALKQINPTNIIGRPPDYSSGFLLGYDAFFPTLKEHWQKNIDLIKIISEQHDVSKHRSSVYRGGKYNTHPPAGFFDKLGIKGDDARSRALKFIYSPMEEILLIPQPKTPWRQRKPDNIQKPYVLEEIAERYCEFINLCGERALNDARSNIILKNYTLHARRYY